MGKVKARPPKKWWDKMLKRISAMKKYRDFPVKRKHKIVAGIWHDYPDKTKLKLIKKYEGEKMVKKKKGKKKGKK